MEDAKTLSPRQAVVVDRLKKFFNYEATIKGLSSKVSENSVVICTGLKSATTWSAQIMQSLRSRGDMSFKEINKVVPALELIAVGGAEKNLSPQQWQPNFYVTHGLYGEIDVEPKVIVITRDCCDAALSLYYFLRNWFFNDEELGIKEFVELIIAKEVANERFALNALQMKHIASWYPHRKDEKVLWLHYEDLKEDLPACIRLMAEFAGFDVKDKELMKIAEEQASFEFMKAHADQYDAHEFKFALNEQAGLPRDAGTGENAVSRVRKGKMNESKEVFTPEIRQIVQKGWDEIVKPVTGFSSYEEMRRSTNAELGRNFQKSQ